MSDYSGTKLSQLIGEEDEEDGIKEIDKSLKCVDQKSETGKHTHNSDSLLMTHSRHRHLFRIMFSLGWMEGKIEARSRLFTCSVAL